MDSSNMWPTVGPVVEKLVDVRGRSVTLKEQALDHGSIKEGQIEELDTFTKEHIS